jgi:hypothetical protein
LLPVEVDFGRIDKRLVFARSLGRHLWQARQQKFRHPLFYVGQLENVDSIGQVLSRHYILHHHLRRFT